MFPQTFFCELKKNMQTLVEKYNIQAPRYTSYPTVPYWDSTLPDQRIWETSVRETYSGEREISLYIHLPFCESLCTYCGCNTRITINHNVETPYLETLLKEWKIYLQLFKSRPRITQIHLGGGTPTFFSAYNLSKFLRALMATAEVLPNAELSFEGHPANTTKEHLVSLFALGFKRLSLGIQDFDPHVQWIIHRQQSFEQVKIITELARETGYESVNFDLVYGLPSQNINGLKDTIEKVLLLKPDRIAFYSYAHVPWIKPGQRNFTEADIPVGKEKRELYEHGRSAFENSGYTEIGFDHFALQHDSLNTAAKNGTINRNFMGYTITKNRLLIGLGASSISDSWNMFVQNEKKVEEYSRRVNNGELPFFKGHVLTNEDLVLRQHILNLMCRQYTSWNKPAQQCSHLQHVPEYLAEMERDGLVELGECSVKVTSAGKPFLRNICMAFDARLLKTRQSSNLFSSSV